MADTGTEEATEIDVSKLKVADLKKALKERGLSVTGNKTELSERLQDALQGGSLVIGADAGAVFTEGIIDEPDEDEELLADHDDHGDSGVLADDSTKEIRIEEESLRLSTSDFSADVDVDQHLQPLAGADVITAEVGTKEDAVSSQEEVSKETATKQQSTKIVLNRTSLPSMDMEKENKKDDEDRTREIEETPKKVRPSEMTLQERMEMRAKRFGVPLSEEAKKRARAEKFGTGLSTNGSSISLSGTNTSLDVLKKRAERFGVSTSKLMVKLEEEEKVKKRQERFKMMDTSTNDLQGKKQQRAVRFGLNDSKSTTVESTEAKKQKRAERFNLDMKSSTVADTQVKKQKTTEKVSLTK